MCVIFEFLDTTFCESIFIPTAYSLKKSLKAAFFYAKRGMHLDDVDHVDLCCRSFYKCDAYKNTIQMTEMKEWNTICECVRSFRECLSKLKSNISNEVAYFVNTIKCHEKDHQESTETGILSKNTTFSLVYLFVI